MADIAALRESVEIESRADLLAVACRFGEASQLLKQANLIRKREFGSGLGPNELRRLTDEAIESGAA